MIDNIQKYTLPYIAIRGIISYAFYQISEKRIIANFDKIKINERGYQDRVEKIPELLTKFVNILEKNVEKENLNNLYYNLKDVKIKKKLYLKLLGIFGKYNSYENSIEYSAEKAIAHELLHLASTCYDKKNNTGQCGFVHYNGLLTFGRALNEGYTDLLARRFFNQKTRIYHDEVITAHFLELLVGEKNMHQYYFNNNIVGLINHLSKYMDKKDAIKFLLDMNLAFEFKNQFNPIYKLKYVQLQLKLYSLLKQYNWKLSTQFEVLKLLDCTTTTRTIIKKKTV